MKVIINIVSREQNISRINIFLNKHIKTHDSELRGQEETAIIRETKNTQPLSELFTRKFVQKFTNALVKPP